MKDFMNQSNKKKLFTSLKVTIIYVSDQKKSLWFYRYVLGMKIVQSDNRFNWIELNTGNNSSNIALLQPNTMTNKKAYDDALTRIGTNTGIIFGTKNLDNFYNRLIAKGVIFKIPPRRTIQGGRCAVFLDPDGNEIQVVEENPDFIKNEVLHNRIL
jgi:catechol 2,3-dioxygenase-like lactoylglutathione lyase family enzyme